MYLTRRDEPAAHTLSYLCAGGVAIGYILVPTAASLGANGTNKVYKAAAACGQNHRYTNYRFESYFLTSDNSLLPLGGGAAARLRVTSQLSSAV